MGGLAFVRFGGLWTVAVGLGVGEAVRVLWLRRQLTKYLPDDAGVLTPDSRGLGRAVVAQTSAGATLGVVPLVERLLATSLGTGAASHLEYAVRLLVPPGVLFEGALAPLLLARWSQDIAAHRRRPRSREVLKPVFGGVSLAACLSLAMIAFSPFYVRVMLLHGRFQSLDAVAVSSLLRILAVGFIANVGSLLLERVYLAASRNRALALLAVARAGVRLIVVLTLLRSGLVAFGVGFVVAEWLYLLGLLAFLHYGSAHVFRPSEGS